MWIAPDACIYGYPAVPNAATPYTEAGLDVPKEPAILSIPDGTAGEAMS